MTNKIHPSAVIGADVKIGENNFIGPNVVIQGNVILGSNNEIHACTQIQGGIGCVVIGDRNYFSSFVSIGEWSQHSTKKFEHNGYGANEQKFIRIGDRNVIREFTTIHIPSINLTEIKDDCYIMAYCHISHDSVIHNFAIMANNSQLGGHTHVHDFANIGLSAVVHQRSTIGAFSMIGMGAIITKDVPPFVVAVGTPVKETTKLNEWGLVKKGFTENDFNQIRKIYGRGEVSVDGISDKKLSSFIKKFNSRSSRKIIKLAF